MKKVAIITRTRDRAALLRRAMRSVEKQTFRDFCWVVVNDAGEHGPVDEVVRHAKEAGIEVHTIHRAESTGMEAASNAGLQASKSQYIAIHDDDSGAFGMLNTGSDGDLMAEVPRKIYVFDRRVAFRQAFDDAEACILGTVVHVDDFVG